MNGIEKITERIEGDIKAEIAEIEAEARRQVAEIEANYEAIAAREREQLLARGRVAAEERVESLLGVAALEAKKLELAAKQEMLTLAFETAAERLAQLGDDEYAALLIQLAVRASRSGTEQVILSQKDRTRLGKRVVTGANEALGGRGALTLSESTRAISGGLLLAQGNVEVNSTFESLLRLLRGSISPEVAKVLFT